MAMKSTKSEMPQGTLDMVILQVVAAGSIHGYALAQRIRLISRDLLQIQQGSLYPALQRLELNGWIEGVWGVSSNNRRARIYRITAAGRKQLALETRKYAKLTLAIARVMEAQ